MVDDRWTEKRTLLQIKWLTEKRKLFHTLQIRCCLLLSFVLFCGSGMRAIELLAAVGVSFDFSIRTTTTHLIYSIWFNNAQRLFNVVVVVGIYLRLHSFMFNLLRVYFSVSSIHFFLCSAQSCMQQKKTWRMNSYPTQCEKEIIDVRDICELLNTRSLLVLVQHASEYLSKKWEKMT